MLHDDRLEFERQSRSYYSEIIPEFDYVGITELESQSLSQGYTMIPRSTNDFYYPVNLVQPLESDLSLVDFDLLSHEVAKSTINEALRTSDAAVSRAFTLFPGSTNLWDQNSVLLVNAEERNNVSDVGMDDLGGVSMVIVNMAAFIARTLSRLNYDTSSVFLFDSTPGLDEPQFLIGVNLNKDPDEYFLPAVEFDDLVERAESLMEIEAIAVASSQWTIVVIANSGEYRGGKTSVVIAGIFIFVASCFLAFWIWSIMRKTRKMQHLRLEADAEKADALLLAARKHAQAEEELNDYIAHEIRNPLAAAMSACSFVKTSISKKGPLEGEEKLVVQEDVDIIDSSLSFMNDLLRSMLDMHKAASKKIDLIWVPVDVKRDILQPVAAMLYRRNSNFTVEVECPDSLIVKTDKLRLKQVVLNLGRNSAKFVNRGYVKLGAGVYGGNVSLYVEDSGPGIPESKKEHLFNKFQESLDVMEQGTGMGLCLCKNMTELLRGNLWLDNSFTSEVKGAKGARFVVDLQVPNMSVDECEGLILDRADSISTNVSRIDATGGVDTFNTSRRSVEDITEEEHLELPTTLSVLFVDDDMVLRKLFSRSVKKVINTWEIQEAADGETALQMARQQEFDVIFMDQYMASVEKTMLGTETVQAMRNVGIKGRICGLSANDVEDGFMKSGADFFLQKPFPCKPDELKTALVRIVCSKRPEGNNFQKVHEESRSTATTQSGGESDGSSKGLAPPKKSEVPTEHR